MKSLKKDKGDRMIRELSDILITILEDYKDQSREASKFAGNYLGNALKDDFKKELNNNLLSTNKQYNLKGSIGQGKWAEIPWFKIASSKNNIHKDTQNGYYIVYLFDAEMRGVYLSLNQGWTYFREKYGSKTGLTRINSISDKVIKELQLKTTNFDRNINLHSNSSYAKGYEAGHIIGKYYSLQELKSLEGDNKLFNDLNELLEIYENLITLIGEKRTFAEFNQELLLNEDNQFTDDDEESYQKVINQENGVKINTEEITNTPRKRKEMVKKRSGIEQYPRDKRMGMKALERANYTCEYHPEFPTFKSKNTNKDYMEAHHLIPIEYAEGFDYDIDQISNIICLNPLCHRMIHYGTDEQKSKMIEIFYSERKEELKEANIEIELHELKSMYGL
ncbi:DUF3578 domain-containing protein [Staphylococcus pettenkoferi]|nr:DUF3578 domain-containing protein [uncultured Staphylococcus sp.]MCY1576074.1 DUF3578 domain-containing protein [Staphylococcus pettenkoferi]MCY1617657.1 DUF3578 domain-containing protein [Staphylococcus pettenkoferi]